MPSRLIKEDTDHSAIRRAIRILKDKNMLLIFPEGARTLNGEVTPFAKGTMVLIKRAKPIIVPAAIEGAFDVWPRMKTWPKSIGRIGVEFGTPIPAEELLTMGTQEALEYLRNTIDQIRINTAHRLKNFADG